VVMLFFGGYGIQVGRESYMIRSMRRSGRNPTRGVRGLALKRCWM